MTVRLILAMTLASLSGATAGADDLSALNGTWEGFLKANPAIELRILFRVDGEKVTMDSPDQTPGELKADEATLRDGTLSLVIKANGGKYVGKADAKAGTIAGTWTQAGQDFPLNLKKTERKEVPPELWEGLLELPGGSRLRLVFRLTEREPGKFRATMDSPDQGAIALKVETAEKTKDTLKFGVPAIKGEFSGKLDGESAAGEWTQGGQVFPITLKKVAKTTGQKRTQQPKPPFSYEVEEVRYENPAAQLTLAGTFTRPKGDGPFPAVLLISGSGPQDRDESLMGHKPFLVLADALTRKGIAVLRVDDRGVGESTGDHDKATSEDFAGDALAGVAYLKTRKDVDPKAIGLCGHSEGGLIAPIAASRSADVSFIVLMAGTGLTGAEILELQTGLILQATGSPAVQVRTQMALIRKLSEIVRDEPDDAKVVTKAKGIVDNLLDDLDEETKEVFRSTGAEVAVKRLTSPWMRYFLAFDPRPTLAQVKCPVLAINGEKDLQVPPKQNLAEIAKALQTGGNTKVTIEEFPGLNHLFQPCKTGSPSEYGSIEETISPAVLDRIGGWILATNGRTG